MRAVGRIAAGALTAVLASCVSAPAGAVTRVEASLSARNVEAGGSVTLVVTVSDPGPGGVEPQYSLPPGLSALGSSSGQGAALDDGRVATQLQYRYSIGADEPGRYDIGPIRVRVGRQLYECNALALVVTPPAAPRAHAPVFLAHRSSAPGAQLVVEVEPQRAYVGQLVQLKLRFLQTQGFESRGDNVPPSVTGFWAEGFGDEVHLRGRLGDRPADVTERRQRIYPLAPGAITVGSAEVSIAPTGGSPDSPEGDDARTIVLTSDSVRVRVVPLPAGAPSTFAGGVGTLTWSWQLDRGHTTQDQAITLGLDVRGLGNLPLLKTPALSLPDFEVFAGTVDDSFAPPGELTPGRRRFVWTLLPRRTGTLRLDPPVVSWFDPAGGGYRSSHLPALEVDVLGPGGPAGSDVQAGTFPGALANDPARPGARPALPWVIGLAGLLAGLGLRRWRDAGATDPLEDERRFAGELLATLKRSRGAEFWRAANHGLEWLAAHGGEAGSVAASIASVRYGGRVVPEDDVRRPLAQRIGDALPPRPNRAISRALAALLVLAGLTAGAFGLGRPAPPALAARARAADQLAREARTAAAASAWVALWREAPGDAALAARLGWEALVRHDLPAATVWTLRGRAGDARDGGLEWVEARVREEGGLGGAPGEGAPLRAIECAALAGALALGAGLEWSRRWSAGLLLAFAAMAVALPIARVRLARPAPLAVVRTSVLLRGTDVALDPGQVVRLEEWASTHATVRAGRDLSGEVDPAALMLVAGEGP